jgi:cell division protein FtsI (penicillin-binding protein 3)
MHTPAADPAAPPREPWRRRLVGSLLYGSNVDRVTKTRARILLAVLIFALGYAVIATRLVIFATAP